MTEPLSSAVGRPPLPADQRHSALLAELPHLDRLVHFLAHGYHDAEDLKQEVCVEMLTADMRGVRDQGAWLRGVTRNRLGSQARSDERRHARERRASVPHEYEAPEETLGRREIAAIVQEEFAELPRDHQDILRLRILDGRPPSAVASALGISSKAVHMRVSRARSRLQAQLRKRLGVNCSEVIALAFRIPARARRPLVAPLAWTAAAVGVLAGAGVVLWPAQRPDRAPAPLEGAAAGGAAHGGPAAGSAVDGGAPRAPAAASSMLEVPAKPPSFHGRVFGDHGQPLEGARVVARSAGTIASTFTDAAGIYELAWSEPAPWIWSSRIYVLDQRGASRVVTGVPPASPPARVDFELRRGHEIRLQALDQRLGIPAAGANLSLADERWIACSVTDEQGRASVSVPYPGTYFLHCLDPTGAGTRELGRLEVSATSAVTWHTVDLPADQSQIRVAAVDARSRARLDGATYELSAAAGDPARLEATAGEGWLRGLQGDRHTLVRVGCPGFETVELDLVAPAPALAAVPLPPAAQRAWQFLMQGRPAAGARVEWTFAPARVHIEPGGRESWSQAAVPLRGEALADGLGLVSLPEPSEHAGRSLRLRVLPAGGAWLDLGRLRYADEPSGPLVYELSPPARSVLVHVTDLDGLPLTDATVTCLFAPNERCRDARRLMIDSAVALDPGTRAAYGASVSADASGGALLEVPFDVHGAWSVTVGEHAYHVYESFPAGHLDRQGLLTLRVARGDLALAGTVEREEPALPAGRILVQATPLFEGAASEREAHMTYLRTCRLEEDGSFRLTGLARAAHRVRVKVGSDLVHELTVLPAELDAPHGVRITLASAN